MGSKASGRSRLEVRVAHERTICEPPRQSRVAASLARTRWNVLPDRRRIGDLHDLRRRLSFLYRQEPHGAEAQRCSACADFLYDLPAVEQPDDTPRRAKAVCRKDGGIRTLVAAHHPAGRRFPFRNRARVGPPDPRRRSHDQYQSVRHHVLLAGRPACVSRDHGPAGPHCGRGFLFHVAAPARSTPSGWRSCRCTGTSSMRFGWSCSRLFT